MGIGRGRISCSDGWAGRVCLDLAHRGKQGFFALIDRSFAIRLQQFPDMTYEIRISNIRVQSVPIAALMHRS